MESENGGVILEYALRKSAELAVEGASAEFRMPLKLSWYDARNEHQDEAGPEDILTVGSMSLFGTSSYLLLC